MNKYKVPLIVFSILFISLLLLLTVTLVNNLAQRTEDSSINESSNIELNVTVDIRNDSTTLNESYTIKLDKRINVFELLNVIKTKNPEFTFSYETYDGLGIFITEINGYKAKADSEFWEFKVNSLPSNVGITEYMVNDGDQIEFLITKITL